MFLPRGFLQTKDLLLTQLMGNIDYTEWEEETLFIRVY
jgi:hypothetical protein